MEDERRHFACELRISIAYSERAIDRREDLLGKMRSLEARRFFLYQKQQSKWSFSHVRKYRLAYACCPVGDDECDQ